MLSTPNPDDFATGREAEADAGLLVKFFHREREDKEATAKAGRPMFKEVEYIEIRIAGKRDAQACRPASERDKARFPRHYEMFKQRVEVPCEGTALSEWPQITRSMVETLSFFQIKTVEQLVSASDTNLSQIHGGIGLKEKAKAFLEMSDQTKLLAEKEELQNKLDEQDSKIAELEAAILKLSTASTEEAPAPKKRRSRKAPAPAELEEADTPEV